MGVVRSFANCITVLNRGELVADGEHTAVIASPVVQKAHLGTGLVRRHGPGKAA
jgi:ABC-type branched-subunit amino acid transport system ATPase component